MARHEGVDRAFTIFDADASGGIDVSELRLALSELGVQMGSDKASAILATYDADRSGALEYGEFRKLVLELRSLDLEDDAAPAAAP